MSESIEYSRALLLGAGATGMPPEKLKERLEKALMVVRVDPDLPGALLTARVLLTTLRRLPGQLALDSTGLEPATVAELVAATASIDSTRPLRRISAPEPEANVQVYVGTCASAGWLRVIPDGYGAQLVDDSGPLNPTREANALGSIFAAALAAAEVFKRTAKVLDNRCVRHRRVRFCPLTLSDDLTLAPELPRHLQLDLALIGNGAIGTAEALILGELGLGGRVILCDPERFGPENRGTYSLGGEREASLEPWKVKLVSEVLSAAGYEVVPVVGRSTDLIAQLDAGALSPPRITLSCLDSAEARRETQGMWSNHIIDAQTGDTAAGLVVALPAGPCLRCFFPPRAEGPDPLARLAAEIGLSVERLRRGSEPLLEDEIADLPPEKQERLRAQIGRPTCGLASALGLTDADAGGYMPAVPFVSQLAACLAIGRLLVLELNAAPGVNWFQLDALRGPTSAGEQRNPLPSCRCQTHPEVVTRTLQRRREKRS
jgi:hypothetical protein